MFFGKKRIRIELGLFDRIYFQGGLMNDYLLGGMELDVHLFGKDTSIGYNLAGHDLGNVHRIEVLIIW